MTPFAPQPMSAAGLRREWTDLEDLLGLVQVLSASEDDGEVTAPIEARRRALGRGHERLSGVRVVREAN